MTLQNTLGVIPGYDPFATAGDCQLDEDAAQKAIDFFPALLRFFEGRTGPFELEAWQQAIVGNLFGWKRPDGTRRYREAFIFVPRKNGKTPLMAGLVLAMLIMDREQGAQLYSAAGDRDQASLIYRHAHEMAMRQPELNKRLQAYKTTKTITYEQRGSFFKALSSESYTKHGLNASLVVVDELHVQPNSELVDVLVTSTASRRQPLILYITTSDYERESICNAKHRYASNVRDGEIDDPSFLPVIYEASRDDDWTDSKVWAAANPNLGVSVSREYLARECVKAQENAEYENTFKRLHLNIRTEQDVRWMQMTKWDDCGGAVDEGALIGRKCFGGLDLSSKEDMTAWVLLFPPEDDGEPWKVLPRFWLPAETAAKRQRSHGVPYPTWIKEGLITTVSGERIEYDLIRKQIEDDGQRYSIVDIGADPWNLEYLRQQLPGSAKIVEFPNSYRNMSQPTKELKSLVNTGKIAHGGHKVLRWNASNVVVEVLDPETIRPSKKKSTEKIDGIVALVMALGRAMLDEGPEESVYLTRGLASL